MHTAAHIAKDACPHPPISTISHRPLLLLPLIAGSTMSALASEKKLLEGEAYHGSGTTHSGDGTQKPEVDVFVDTDDHQIRYKTLSWQVCSAVSPALCQ